ncbi:MAG: hypothetical protein OEM98_15330, partial [Gammaproteobacteria bacterium]|nr:hypothetical protein [Gammaproteobacteria bacterium]
ILSGVGNQRSAAREREGRPDQVTDAVKSFAFVHAGLIIRSIDCRTRLQKGWTGWFASPKDIGGFLSLPRTIGMLR